jgi:hypothetical protein
MLTFSKRLGLPAMMSLAALASAVPGVRGQANLPTFSGSPIFGNYVPPVRGLGQAAAGAPNALFNPAAGPRLVNNQFLPGTGPFTGYPGSIINTPYGAYDPSAYSEPYGWWGDPYGGYLRGVADIVNAQGRFAIAQQQAVLVREQIREARLVNRRRAFDEFLYERDRMPTLQDDRERTQAQELRRAMYDPPMTEIWSGKALNDLLNDLQRQLAKGTMSTFRGPREQLDQDALARINVTSSRGGNIGLLKNGARLNWPLALSGEEFKAERERLNNLVQDTLKEAGFNNKIDAGTLRQMIDDVDRLQKQLGRSVGELSPAQYIESKRFLNDFNDALKVLQQPDAANYINGKYAAKGKTVPELVKYMTDQGLQFAPAVAGDEAAYLALQRAMAGFALGLQSQAPRE